MHEKVKLVKVEWQDSSVLPGWRNGTHDHLPGLVSSVGYLIEQTSEHVVLTTSISNEGAVLYPLAIPTGAIDSITELAVGKRRKSK